MPANKPDNEQEQQSASLQQPQVATHSFTGAMKKDINDTFTGDGTWAHARNLVNFSQDGQKGTVGNEPANIKLCDLPYDLIGALHIYRDEWVIFTTDDINCEIGTFVEGTGIYTKVANDPGLGLKRTNLITGAVKQNFDCTWQAYWDDGLNPSRTVNLQNPPYLPSSISNDSCATVTYSTQLDVEGLRLTPLLTVPRISLQKGHGGGSLLNGSYQAIVAYTVNQIRVTDYFSPSNVQGLFSHENAAGSLEVDIASMDPQFDEFELVILSIVNNQTSARRMGTYSTHQKTVYIDHVAETLPAIPIDLIPLQAPAYEKADSMYEVNNYLIRTGITAKFDFNYQVQAAKITSKWVAVKYPQDYYVKAGNNVGHMRDEVYPYFIRWIYNTGQRSASYHIPGRVSIASDLDTMAGPDALELAEGAISQRWQVQNTASITSLQTSTLPDGGVIVAQGEMGYWESTEIYPTDKYNVWGSLCGQPIRHHKFPDNSLINHHDQGGNNILILGVQFENISQPLDNEGNPITSITGYEILRGSREGNRSIVAKGLINNMGEYDIPNGPTGLQGLYPNYPYNDLRTDPFLSKNRVSGGCGDPGYQAMGTFRRDVFTFHSPETSFKRPFLDEYELKVHGELSGNVLGNYDMVDKHPRHKLVRDFALIIAGIIGIGEALFKVKGKKNTTNVGPHSYNNSWIVGGVVDGGSVQEFGGSTVAGYYTVDGIGKLIGDVSGLSAVEGIIGIDQYTGMAASIVGNALTSWVPGVVTGSIDVQHESNGMSEIPLAIRVLEGIPTFMSLFAQSTDQILDIIRGFSPYQQYGYQYNSHGLYDTYTAPQLNNTRRTVLKANYIDQHLQDFTENFQVNNLFRGKTIAVQLSADLSDPHTQDNTRQTIGNQGLYTNPTQSFITKTSAHYASLKIQIPSQYGQLENILQVPVPGSFSVAPGNNARVSTGVLFGGDTYINRFTEKNTFFYFNDWLHNEQDGFEYDYRLRYNLPYARYWIDSQKYDAAQFVNGLYQLNFGNGALPNGMAHLDRDQGACDAKISFIISQAYFYLFNNGVRDFFVESEVNLAYRDHGDTLAEEIYEPAGNTNLKTLFRSDIIKSGNYYKYDYSLSTGKLYQNFISWGNILPRWYDPAIAETCYSYYPKRAVYSLQQQTEFLKDNWRVFLVNNYKDFPGVITAVKQIAQNSSLIMMQNDAPVMFQGVDQLQTNAGIKLTIGDGGLFSGPMQPVSSGDTSFEYGSTQSKFSISATPNGLYYMSAEQGKVFEHGGIRQSYYQQPLQDMSAQGMKYWFELFLPYQILKDFPNFSLTDNPLIGVGCMSVFDNSYELIYFSKRDYRLKDEYKGQLVYFKDNIFLNNGNQVLLGDPLYFWDASWTISLDQPTKSWISFHDWHPDFMLPGKTHFMTVKDRAIWKHNSRCDLFCNFYGVDYPFEIEPAIATGQSVNTVKSLEYLLECYQYAPNCLDKFHEYSFNFDQAMIYNSEQHTGMLNLNYIPVNNPAMRLRYPKVNPNGIDILYSKEEQKYRFNQFWDCTKDRGQLSGAEIQMWKTHANGYERTLNPLYTDYNKPPVQRKKLRHQYHKVFLRRAVSGSIKMIFKILNVKLNSSER